MTADAEQAARVAEAMAAGQALSAATHAHAEAMQANANAAGDTSDTGRTLDSTDAGWFGSDNHPGPGPSPQPDGQPNPVTVTETSTPHDL